MAAGSAEEELVDTDQAPCEDRSRAPDPIPRPHQKTKSGVPLRPRETGQRGPQLNLGSTVALPERQRGAPDPIQGLQQCGDEGGSLSSSPQEGHPAATAACVCPQEWADTECRAGSHRAHGSTWRCWPCGELLGVAGGGLLETLPNHTHLTGVSARDRTPPTTRVARIGLPVPPSVEETT
ncbi:hypothetical protein NDU88_000117 [Pleurodeles waltl]|uniref:Uncharacterized protein n=1 Tax=Pleurodeles waltl TaxID=8319 RepID=A0AAV7UPL6_PLEWA|nr:hypothetical protein NDU88_000117 [Pleurodeles waltl]